MKTFYSVTTTVNNRGRVTCNITSSIEALEKPADTEQSTRTKDVYVNWFSSLKEARKYVSDSKNA